MQLLSDSCLLFPDLPCELLHHDIWIRTTSICPRCNPRVPADVDSRIFTVRPASGLCSFSRLLIVGGAVMPVWQLLGGPDSRADIAARPPERLTRLFIGPEQFSVMFGSMDRATILQSRYREVLRWRARSTSICFRLKEGARIRRKTPALAGRV